MKVLILDDEGRLKEFRKKFLNHIVIYVNTAKEAIKELSKGEIDVVFLDHDLGGKINVPSGPGTGYEVVQWLEQNPDKQPKEIFIHSFNSVGARNIQSALLYAKIVPGAWAHISSKEDYDNWQSSSLENFHLRA